MTGSERPPAWSGRRGPTQRGWALLAVGVIAVAAAFALDERDLLFVGFLCLGLPAASAAMVGMVRPRVKASATIEPSRLVQGEAGTLRVRLTSPRRWVGSVAVWLPEIPGLWAATVVDAPRPRGSSVVEARGEVRPSRRGRYQLGEILVTATDPFGLWLASRPAEAPLEVVVLPATVALTGLPGAREGREASLGRGRNVRASGDPDVSVRPYRMGDDVRLIHWSASARLDDELVVRVTEHRRLPDVAMLIDARPDGYPRPGQLGGELLVGGVDVAAMLTASAGLALLASDVDLTLVNHAGRVLLDGATSPGDLLEALAVVGKRPPRFRPQLGTTRDLLIAVVGRLDSTQATGLAQQRPPATPAIAFVVADPDVGPGAAPEVLGRFGWVVEVLDGRASPVATAAQRIEQAWASACQADGDRVGAGR